MSEFLVAARLGRPPRGKGCVKQMASVEKYCCSLHPKHAMCAYVCLKDSVLPAHALAVCPG